MSDFSVQHVGDAGNQKTAEALISPTAIEARLFDGVPHDSLLEALETVNRLKIRSDICRFLIRSLSLSTTACFGLIVLQGFHPWGFQMDATLLKWLCGVTIAKSGVLLAVFTNAVWQKSKKTTPNDQKLSA